MILSKSIKNKLYHYFVKKLGSYNYRKGWIKSDCPKCGKHKFGINLSLNKSNCFYCEYNEKPLDLVMELEGVNTLTKVFDILKDLSGIQYEYQEVILEPKNLKLDTKLPEHYYNIRFGKTLFAKTARNYLIKRGFDLNRLSQAGWGYCTNGKYQGYIIMPFYQNNRLVYFNARRYMGYGPKFNNPDIEDFGLGKSMIIYNVDALYLYDKIYLVESITNSETLGANSISTGGKKVSGYQLDIIIKSPAKKIIIGLDDDAIQDAIKLAFKLIDYKRVKIMIMPKDKDINDIGKEKSKLIAQKNHYLNYRELLKLKHKYD